LLTVIFDRTIWQTEWPAWMNSSATIQNISIESSSGLSPSSVLDPDPDWIRIQLGQRVPDSDPEGHQSQHCPVKRKKMPIQSKTWIQIQWNHICKTVNFFHMPHILFANLSLVYLDAYWTRRLHLLWRLSAIHSEPSTNSRRKFTFLNIFYSYSVLWSTGCSLVRAEGVSCSLDVLYGGLGISKLQFFWSKK